MDLEKINLTCLGDIFECVTFSMDPNKNPDPVNLNVVS